MFAEQMTHLLNEFQTDTRMAANQGVHANQDGTSNPRFRHGGMAEGVEKRERIALFGGDHASVLML